MVIEFIAGVVIGAAGGIGAYIAISRRPHVTPIDLSAYQVPSRYEPWGEQWPTEQPAGGIGTYIAPASDVSSQRARLVARLRDR